MTSPTSAQAARPARSGRARPKVDAVAAAATDLARRVLEEVAEPGQVGEHLGVEAIGDRLVAHTFECTMPGYRGWTWNVTVARAPRAKHATVDETSLLPGDGALLSPDWHPWSERLRPEDIGPDDLMPYQATDERLEFGYEQTDDEEADRVALWELGLGRVRVLSPDGRSDAAQRWAAGQFGPREISSRGRKGTVTAACSSCGFLSQLPGALRGEFGICTNEWSPADGRVVHLGYGCGSHSETGQEETGSEFPMTDAIVVDDLRVEYDTVRIAAEPEPEPAAEPAAVEPEEQTAAEPDSDGVEPEPVAPDQRGESASEWIQEASESPSQSAPEEGQAAEEGQAPEVAAGSPNAATDEVSGG